MNHAVLVSLGTVMYQGIVVSVVSMRDPGSAILGCVHTRVTWDGGGCESAVTRSRLCVLLGSRGSQTSCTECVARRLSLSSCAALPLRSRLLLHKCDVTSRAAVRSATPEESELALLLSCALCECWKWLVRRIVKVLVNMEAWGGGDWVERHWRRVDIERGMDRRGRGLSVVGKKVPGGDWWRAGFRFPPC